jgi:Uma2 family endonuclease
LSGVKVQDYLGLDFEPSCELLNGELVEKPPGTREHMRIEARLRDLLKRFEESMLGEALPELSVRRGHDVLIPDFAFVPAGATYEDGILVSRPLLCVEILSPSQRPSVLFRKCEMYHDWDIPFCWVIDPLAKVAWEYHQGQPLRMAPESGLLRAGELEISLTELFS